MYAYLYDSMIACYTRQNISGRYVHWYAATTLASMGFLNLLALVVVLAHWHYRWGERLFAMLSAWQAAAALGLALLGANLFYSRWRKSVAAITPTLPLRSKWAANIYMLLSVLAILYLSTFAVPPHQ